MNKFWVAAALSCAVFFLGCGSNEGGDSVANIAPVPAPASPSAPDDSTPLPIANPRIPACRKLSSDYRDFDKRGRPSGRLVSLDKRAVTCFLSIAEASEYESSLKLPPPVLKDSEQAVLDEYVGGKAYQVNPALRAKSEEALEPYREFILTLKKALLRSRAFSSFVFRGSGYPPLEAKDLKQDAIFREPAFLSTSRKLGVGTSFAGNGFLSILLSKWGRPAAYGPNTGFPNEAEVIFIPQSRFRVIYVGQRPAAGPQLVFLEELQAGKNLEAFDLLFNFGLRLFSPADFPQDLIANPLW